MHPSDKEALANMIADYFDDYGKFCNMECWSLRQAWITKLMNFIITSL
jgi:hypothetical protein